MESLLIFKKSLKKDGNEKMPAGHGRKGLYTGRIARSVQPGIIDLDPSTKIELSSPSSPQNNS